MKRQAEIAARLNRFRQGRGYTIKGLAIVMSMSPSVIVRATNGTRALTFEDAIDFCTVFGVSLEQLAGTQCTCANCVHPQDLKDLI